MFITHWKAGWEPGRGYGTYLTACWYGMDDRVFNDGALALSVTDDRPLIYRRLLYRFSQQVFSADAPYPWYRSPAARVQICMGAQPTRCAQYGTRENQVCSS